MADTAKSATIDKPHTTKVQNKPLRERGTLNQTLPRRPIFIILLVGLVSSALAAQLSVYSISSSQSGSNEFPAQDELKKMWLVYFGIASLGSAQTSVGIMFGDSFSQSFALGSVLLLLGFFLGDNQTAFTPAIPSLIVSTLASVTATRMALSSFKFDVFSYILFNPIIIQSITLFSCLGLIFNVYKSSTGSAREFSLIPSFALLIITLLLILSYVENRSHKNGCLLDSKMKSQAFVAMLCSTLSYVQICRLFPFEGVVLLLGSLFTLTISLFFAAVADVWYAVGSGQFQMVSLDTAGMMVYFIAPVVLLFFRFLGQYGHALVGFVVRVVEYAVETAEVPLADGADYKEHLVFLLSVVTAAGVPLTNALCPMGGYLFARAYTHGQPNTKKVAVCVNFSDLTKANLSTLPKAIKSNDGRSVVLNVFATYEDLLSSSDKLKALDKNGHYIALSPSFKSGMLTGLSLFQGKLASCSIEKSFHQYLSVFGRKASWAISDSTDSLGRHPNYLRKARDFGLKVSYWSTLVHVEGRNLSGEQKNIIERDAADKNGGSIIYIQFGRGFSGSSLSDVLTTVFDSLKEFSIESLSEVVKDDATMTL